MRSWAAVLGFAVLLVFQMVSLQQQIGELRTDLHREIGDLRTGVQKEIGDLRTDVQKEIGDLRDDLRTDIGALGERIVRLEALMERGAAPRPGG